MNPTGIAALAVLSICALSACAPTTPTFDQNFGESARVLQAQQVRNPEAPVANRDKLPDGLDGRAAHAGLRAVSEELVHHPAAAQPMSSRLASELASDRGERADKHRARAVRFRSCETRQTMLESEPLNALIVSQDPRQTRR